MGLSVPARCDPGHEYSDDAMMVEISPICPKSQEKTTNWGLENQFAKDLSGMQIGNEKKSVV
jgi:hypothetical protein